MEALQKARELIKKYPDNFKDDDFTAALIAFEMFNYQYRATKNTIEEISEKVFDNPQQTGLSQMNDEVTEEDRNDKYKMDAEIEERAEKEEFNMADYANDLLKNS